MIGAQLSGIHLPFHKQVTLFAPTLYRYLPKEYVEIFFDTGSFMLSCFANFRRHLDEMQGDRREGLSLLMESNDDRFVGAYSIAGDNAYVSSFTTKVGSIGRAFGDDAIEVFSPIEFAMEVTNEIAGSLSSMLGPCIYVDRRILKQEGQALPKDATFDDMTAKATQMSGPGEFFLKENKYQSQSEYRMIWETNRTVSASTIIQIQNPQRFCRYLKSDS